jgi:hypothetical protein
LKQKLIDAAIGVSPVSTKPGEDPSRVLSWLLR